MRPSSKPLRLLMLLLVLGLGACGGLRRDDEAPPETVTGTTKPAAGKPAKPGATKPAPKPVDKGDPQARFAQALEMMRGNDLTEAETAFKSLAQDFPDFSGPWTNLGILYAKSNRRDAAFSAFNRAVSLNTSNAIAYNWLGMLYREAKDYGRAEKAYKFALGARADYGLAHLNLGILYDEYLKRPADAEPHYREYQKLDGKNDLRVQAWLAEIAAARKPASAAEPVR